VIIQAWNKRLYKQVFDSTLGIFFFATPHRGTKVASTLNNILRLAGRGKRFIQDQQAGSREIAHINELFAERSVDMTLISFWESTNSSVLGVRSCRDQCANHLQTIVDQTSATLGYPLEFRIPLNGNHDNIVKFDSEWDSNYRTVSEFIIFTVKRLLRSENLDNELGDLQ
jgi:hypothetical protein